jgi:predicted glycoside hydrolase/deacetylase ChbG (UPF0249 family)
LSFYIESHAVPKLLIVNADDLGISVPTNIAVGRGFRHGIVTSASLLANMPATAHAVERIVRPNPGLGVGVHLCLTSGRPVLPAGDVPLLVGRDGRFQHGFLGLLRLVRSRRRGDAGEALDEIARELAAQAARIDQLGVAVDHVDSHQHVHMIPEVYPVAASLARARGAALRWADERLGPRHVRPRAFMRYCLGGGIPKKLLLSWFARCIRRRDPEPAIAARYFGVLDAGRMTPAALGQIVRGLPEGASEIGLHPGLAAWLVDSLECSRADRRFLRRAERGAELAAVLDPALRAELVGEGIVLGRFRDVLPRGEARRTAPA